MDHPDRSHTDTHTRTYAHRYTRRYTRPRGNAAAGGARGGVPTAPSKSLRIPSRCSFTESRAMGEEGGGRGAAPHGNRRAERSRSGAAERAGTAAAAPGCAGEEREEEEEEVKEREEEGRAAGGGGGGGRYCPHPAPAGSPPTRIPRAWHRRVVPGGPVFFGHHRGAAAHSPLKAAGRAGDPLPGPTEGSKGGLRPAPPPPPGLLGPALLAAGVVSGGRLRGGGCEDFLYSQRFPAWKRGEKCEFQAVHSGPGFAGRLGSPGAAS